MQRQLIRTRTSTAATSAALTDSRKSALLSAGYILNKLARNRVNNRTLLPGNYLIMFILAGTGVYEDPRNGVIEVKPGDAIITFPGLPHSYNPHVVWDEAYLALRGGLFEQMEKDELLRRDRPVISTGLSPAIASQVNSVVEDFVQQRPLSNPVQTARAHMLLASMMEAHQSGLDAAAGVAQDSEFVQRACALLDQQLERELDGRFIANHFGFGYERFRKLFAEQTGVSPAKYRILRRIDRAKTLLLEGRTPLKTIAEQLGYCDVYFFARQFKQVSGKTPGEFRRF